jgi:acetyl esterase/lipase
LHGSAWAYGDKDTGTRSFFRHLAAQGHTVMDVAYRLIPEVDIYGMVGDAKRAVAWMKANAASYGVNPEKIVLGGSSAGAHIALLTAYTPQYLELIPDDVKRADLSVCGVVSYYGNTDLVACYDSFNIEYLVGRPSRGCTCNVSIGLSNHPCSSRFPAHAAYSGEPGLPCSRGRHLHTLQKTG